MSWIGYGTCPICGIATEQEVEPMKGGPILVGTLWYCGVCGNYSQQIYEQETT